MIISPFSSLFFDVPQGYHGRECPFTQFFAKGDRIYIQTIRTASETAQNATIQRLDTSGSNIIPPTSQSVGGGTYIDQYVLTPQNVGVYSLKIGDSESQPFEVTEDEEMIAQSVMFEFSPTDNTIRTDAVALLGDYRIFFNIRMPGGFKPSGYDFSVDNEQFVTQYSDIVELYARESTQETLTIGWSRGVPIWFGQMLNRLLTCKYVYIDGKRYARFQSSVPEKTQTMEEVNSFTFTQKLQRINHINPSKS